MVGTARFACRLFSVENKILFTRPFFFYSSLLHIMNDVSQNATHCTHAHSSSIVYLFIRVLYARIYHLDNEDESSEQTQKEESDQNRDIVRGLSFLVVCVRCCCFVAVESS